MELSNAIEFHEMCLRINKAKGHCVKATERVLDELKKQTTFRDIQVTCSCGWTSISGNLFPHTIQIKVTH